MPGEWLVDWLLTRFFLIIILSHYHIIMKNLRITSGVKIADTHYAEGDIVEGVDNSIAAEIVAAGRAVVIDIEPAAIVIPDPIVKTRDPQPKADRKSKAVDAPADA